MAENEEKFEETRMGLIQAVPVRIIIPVVLTAVLFFITIFFLILPMLKDQMMARKREMLRELTKSAWSTLEAYYFREASGQMSRERAQELAVDHLRRVRYGPEMKDYFWINDMHPNLVMHPYRSELEGKDISHYADPNGKLLFVEFVKTVEKSGDGYVDYEWQWKDDPERIVPKISYVKGFSPWGWIVGTGIYIEDVRAEIAAVTRQLTLMSFGILGIVLLLSSYIIWQGLKTDQRRLVAERRAKLQQEQIFQAAKMASLGTLVSGVAHEINNPVTSVMLNAPIVQRVWKSIEPVLEKHCEEHGDFKVGSMSYNQLRDRVPRLLEDIADGAQRVKVIVGDLKDYARQAPAQMSDTVDVNNVLKKAAGLTSNLLKKSTSDFTIQYGENVPKFKGNSQRIEQVVVNLLVNACQALRDGKQPIAASTFYDEEKKAACVRVADGGEGMPPEVLERIRDPFYTTKRDSGGTGLGLSISDKIVQDHGGKLLFESEPGRGTTATVILPVKNNPERVS